jgi:Ser/Thr protein kinase RdoA (MazF antagonist)
MPSAATVGTDQATDADALADVAASFDLGAIRQVRVVAEGLMNRNWRVETDRGTWAVKQVLDVDAATARRQHMVTRSLALRGRPVPVPKRTAEGDTLLERHGNLYAVSGWARGVHRHGLDLTAPQARSLGALLADLHTDLAQELPAVPVRMREPAAEAASAKDRIDRYAAAANRPDRDSMDTFVLDRMRQRRLLLAQVADLRPADDIEVGPCGWIHGDFQHLNVLWDGGMVSAVLDWDRVKPRPLAAEVVRAGTLLFGSGDEHGLDLHRVAAFADGYRSRRPLVAADLADAVHRLWWERVCDTWQLKRRYEHDDTSCDHLFRSAEALLAWWTTHRAQVTAAFTG